MLGAHWTGRYGQSGWNRLVASDNTDQQFRILQPVFKSSSTTLLSSAANMPSSNDFQSTKDHYAKRHPVNDHNSRLGAVNVSGEDAYSKLESRKNTKKEGNTSFTRCERKKEYVKNM
jgi:hypothetical protein